MEVRGRLNARPFLIGAQASRLHEARSANIVYTFQTPPDFPDFPHFPDFPDFFCHKRPFPGVSLIEVQIFNLISEER
jgi:hypothetical protein